MLKLVSSNPAPTAAVDAVDAIAQGEAPAIGTPASPPGGAAVAYVVAVRPEESSTYTICAPMAGAPMARNRWQVTLARADGYLSEMSEHIAAPMIYRARGCPPISETEAAALLESATAKRDASRARMAAERAEAEKAREAAAAEFARLRPTWAKSAIIAELDEDCSDIMTDYHGHRTTRTIVLAWSRHERDLFPEMRKAALLHPETAHLADAPADAEHREKYSMGAGYYLKQGWRDSSGWCIKKLHGQSIHVTGLEFSDAARGIETPTPDACTPTGEEGANAAGLFRISQHVHTRKGFDMWIAELVERVERDDFDRFLQSAKALRGWYSRAWQGTPAGFAFKSEAAALEFVGKGA